MSDKGDTFVFKPEDLEQKNPVKKRTVNDAYSKARKVGNIIEEESSNNNTLLYVCIGLVTVLIITIVIGIFVLKSGMNPEKNSPSMPEEDVILVDDEEKEEENLPDESEKEKIVNNYDMIFDSQRISPDGSGYAVYAELLSGGGSESRKILITKETVIRDNGKRISIDAFANVVKNQGGNLIVFSGEVREEDNVALSVNYDSSEYEEEAEEPENVEEEVQEETTEQPENQTPEEAPQEETPQETPEEEPVTETAPQEGQIIE